MTEQQLREEMVQIGASLFSRGYATGSAGNLSLLLPDGNPGRRRPAPASANCRLSGCRW